MNKKTKIHFLLIFSLCFGQFVSKLHLIDHLDHHDHGVNSSHGQAINQWFGQSRAVVRYLPNTTATHRHEHLSAEADAQHHSHQHAANHAVVLSMADRTEPQASNESNFSGADCQIYHDYLNLSACPSVVSGLLASVLQPSVTAVIMPATVAFRAGKLRKIRGPPVLS